MGSPGFWENRAEADGHIKTLGKLRDVVRRYRDIERALGELDASWNEELFFAARRKFRELELEQLFTGSYDRQFAAVSVYPGVGGEDAEDWARMLFEMYEGYAKRRGWVSKVVDDNPRARVLEVRGEYAYGYLKKESGVHRLVRISPFSAKHLRHTSFALVEVVPDLPAVEESKIVIPEKDLKLDFFRSGGPGGQNVNKVETAVRVTHLPTGLIAASQVERSQAQNRDRAVKLLKAKLIRLMEEHKVDELAALRTRVKPEWGSQIRSYFLNPYQLVKDHRTEVQTAKTEEVLKGDIDQFIEAEVELAEI
ncbi:PCRF domain-containing protein [Candidatus Parcubacteria bacterium]|nr:MAG: PCRF domain-containing protein [Candidatus Parcubacteria bacterium]